MILLHDLDFVVDGQYIFHDILQDDDDVKLPICEVDGKNYKRCDPDEMEPKDESTCEDIDDYACNKKFWKKSTNKGKKSKSERSIEEEEEYCECIGLEYYEPESSIAQLRGAFKNLYAHNQMGL